MLTILYLFAVCKSRTPSLRCMQTPACFSPLLGNCELHIRFFNKIQTCQTSTRLTAEECALTALQIHMLVCVRT